MYCSLWHQQSFWLILAKQQTTARANYSMMIIYTYIIATPSHTLVSGHNQANKRAGDQDFRTSCLQTLSEYMYAVINTIRSEFVHTEPHLLSLSNLKHPN